MLDWGVYGCCLTKANIRDRKQKVGTDIISKSQFSPTRSWSELSSTERKTTAARSAERSAATAADGAGGSSNRPSPLSRPQLCSGGGRQASTQSAAHLKSSNQQHWTAETQMGPKWREFSRTGAENGEISMGHADKRHCSCKTGHE